MMDQSLQAGDRVEILKANGVADMLAGQMGTVVKIPSADRVTVEVKGLLVGNFRPSVLKRL